MVTQSSWEAERAEGLAKVILTRSHDLDVFESSDHSPVGFDLLVRATKGDASGIPLFAVELKSVRDARSNGKRTTRFIVPQQLIEEIDVPLMLLVVDLGTEQGHYVWLIEPTIDNDGHAVLAERADTWVSPAHNSGAHASIPRDALKPLDTDAVKQIAKQAAEWEKARDRPTRSRQAMSTQVHMPSGKRETG